MVISEVCSSFLKDVCSHLVTCSGVTATLGSAQLNMLLAPFSFLTSHVTEAIQISQAQVQQKHSCSCLCALIAIAAALWYSGLYELTFNTFDIKV